MPSNGFMSSPPEGASTAEPAHVLLTMLVLSRIRQLAGIPRSLWGQDRVLEIPPPGLNCVRLLDTPHRRGGWIPATHAARGSSAFRGGAPFHD
ncbi:hypothetical protein ABL78_8188 [Leptomonas seymouri]|uniref:Uncharacterized protein n=1 Tax=Leptomonas seymouri TaxID=5684 RepID=A0A0N1P9U5_LEPSE|nr:hypothetical protein ABL78_8188 [Leptomonas seymouri]|eukprot:KPI82798.1 hypothetical protein ABL78_8188 [Leptomonas seymouri]